MAMGKGSVNRVTLVGNLGNDPALTKTKNGATVATVTLATNEIWKDNQGNRQEHTEWHRVVLWRRLAEIVCQHLKKGSKLYVEGSLRTRSWDDKNGHKRYITEVIADKVTMLDKKNDGTIDGKAPVHDAPAEHNSPMEPEDVPF